MTIARYRYHNFFFLVYLFVDSELKSPTTHIIQEIYEVQNAHEAFEAELEKALVARINYIIVEPARLGGEYKSWIQLLVRSWYSEMEGDCFSVNSLFRWDCPLDYSWKLSTQNCRCHRTSIDRSGYIMAWKIGYVRGTVVRYISILYGIVYCQLELWSMLPISGKRRNPRMRFFNERIVRSGGFCIFMEVSSPKVLLVTSSGLFHYQFYSQAPVSAYEFLGCFLFVTWISIRIQSFWTKSIVENYWQWRHQQFCYEIGNF